MSSALPYMQFYVADYLADTMHLSTIEHGAYLLLIMNYWQRGEALPADDDKLARIARMSIKEWRGIRDTISEFFAVEPTGWTHGRVERDLEIVRGKSEQARNAGLASAQRRAQRKSNGKATGVGTDVATGMQRNGNHAKDTRAGLDTRTDTRTEEPPVVPQAGDDELTNALEAYNTQAALSGWSRVEKFSQQRKSKLRARLKDCGGISGWLAALERASKAPWLNGENDGGWRADFDFLVKDSKFTKLMEGGYDKRHGGNGKYNTRDSIEQAIAFRRFEEAQAGGGDSGDQDPPLLSRLRQSTS